MTCDSVSKLIPLYFYAELTPDDEDRVEQHLHECARYGGGRSGGGAHPGGGVEFSSSGPRSRCCCWKIAGWT